MITNMLMCFSCRRKCPKNHHICPTIPQPFFTSQSVNNFSFDGFALLAVCFGLRR